jgi:hypothetical protein
MVINNDLANTCQMIDDYLFGESYKRFQAANPPPIPDQFTGICCKSFKYGRTLRLKLEPAAFSHHLLEMETVDVDNVFSITSSLTLDRLRYWLHRQSRNLEFCYRISGVYLLKPRMNDPLPRMGVIARLTHIRLFDGNMLGIPTTFAQMLGLPPSPLERNEVDREAQPPNPFKECPPKLQEGVSKRKRTRQSLNE